MKVCLGQINTTPGDFAGNAARIEAAVEAAAAGGADLLVCPELSIPGYLSQDLLYHPDYIDSNLRYLQRICDRAARVAPGLAVVVGFVERNRGGGKPFANCAAVLRGGQVLCVYRKQLLPFYDVFDELRYFHPGSEPAVVEVAGQRVGIAICEDLWNDKGTDDERHADNPLARYREAGVEVVVSLNASPYVHDKPVERLRRLAAGCRGLTLVYVNQCGGQDELVFDGHSFVLRDDRLLALVVDPMRDSHEIVDLEKRTDLAAQVSLGGADAVVRSRACGLRNLLILGLRDYAGKSGFDELVLASSGGVDSAVVASLAVDAVGARNVHAVRMPSVFSSVHSREDALALHRALGCWDYEVPIEHEPVLAMLNRHFAVHGDAANLVTRRFAEQAYHRTADENIQARLRDVYLMHFSNAFGAMPLATGNKTESACGFYTHFDMNFSYAPIKDLYKHDVVGLACSDPRLPDNIWRKPPSAELAEGQLDETSLLPYALLDPIVEAHIEHYVSRFEDFRAWVEGRGDVPRALSMDRQQLQDWLVSSAAAAEFDRIIRLISAMEYKRRQTCPGTKVSKVAFGSGRRVPIVERWRYGRHHDA